MGDFDGFVPIEAIFYTVFHPIEGTKVTQQVPPGAIVIPSKSTSDVLAEPLFDFDLIKNYIIPKNELCHRLITLKIGQYRIIGYPVNINAPYYARNSFSFNFCFVFKYEGDTTPYESAIRRLGSMMKNLEEQYQLLSKKEQDKSYFKDDRSSAQQNIISEKSQNTTAQGKDLEEKPSNKDDSGIYQQIISQMNDETDSSTPLGITQRKGYTLRLDSIESLIQQIYQDLNNYSECLIPIDSGNSVDIKLFPIFARPPRLNPEDVPIATVRLESLVDVNWDVTMRKILPFINGINSISKIAVLANADFSIVQQCIQHLFYYKCIITIDIFQFSNIYAPTSDIDLFLKDDHMAEDCQAYVVSASIFHDKPFSANKSLKSSEFSSQQKISKDDSSNSLAYLGQHKKKESIILPSKAKLFFLYRSLHQGQTVQSWYKEHSEALTHIDIRRFLSFGVLRGLIYRVHSYPVIDSGLLHSENYLGNLRRLSFDNPADTMYNKDYGEEGQSVKSTINSGTTKETDQESQERIRKTLVKGLRDVKNFDTLCTNLRMDKTTLQAHLRRIGTYNVVNS